MGSRHHVEAGEPWHREQENGNLGRVALAGGAEWRRSGEGALRGAQLGKSLLMSPGKGVVLQDEGEGGSLAGRRRESHSGASQA